MTYAVKEIYHTLQGEGANTGRAAVLLRFAGCNLWTGHERDRRAAICRFCDTDFVGTDGPGGGKFHSAAELADAVQRNWPDPPVSATRRFVILTGGEPVLQVDPALITALHDRQFEIALETNGTIEVVEGVDWICVSPKAGAELVQQSGDELKFVYPQSGAEPSRFEALDFKHFFLQPMDGPELERNTELALRYCMEHPPWRLSLQTHKLLGIP